MSINDGFLRTVPSDTDVDDGRLYDPTVADAVVVAPTPDTLPVRYFRPQLAIWRRRAAAIAFLMLVAQSCVDINFTVRAPCSASVTQPLTGDTLYKLAVDSTACPR